MRTVFEHIRARLLPKDTKTADFTQMRDTEWSAVFERYMRNRLVVGGYRYGLMADSDRPRFDHVGAILDRASWYLQDGNQEHLVDVANLALLEFVRRCCHPAPHWSPTDDTHHVEVIDDTKQTS